MNLNHISKDNQLLSALLSQANQWQKLDKKIKKRLLPNIAEYYQLACIHQGILIFHAHNAMVASRLKMTAPAMLEVFSEIVRQPVHKVQVKVKPFILPRPKQKRATMTDTAKTEMGKAAEKLTHYPELADALLNLEKRGKRL